MPQIAGRFMSIRATIYVPGGLLPREPRRFLCPSSTCPAAVMATFGRASGHACAASARGGTLDHQPALGEGHERSRQGAPQTRFPPRIRPRQRVMKHLELAELDGPLVAGMHNRAAE